MPYVVHMVSVLISKKARTANSDNLEKRSSVKIPFDKHYMINFKRFPFLLFSLVLCANGCFLGLLGNVPDTKSRNS